MICADKKHIKKLCGAYVTFFALLTLLCMSACADDGGEITAQMTMKEIRANQTLIESGYFLYSRGEDRISFNETSWDDKKLNEYVSAAAADDTAKALNLVIENQKKGVKITHQVYTQEEIDANSSLGCVQLFYFPAEQSGTKYALVVSGNAGSETGELGEGAASAWQLHELGYAVFVLRYRSLFEASDNAPLNDLCRAVQYITENADEFSVQAEDYAIVGYSSGGHLAGLFCNKKLGYKKYGLPRPGALLMGYPVNDFAQGKLVYHVLMDPASLGWNYYWSTISESIDEDFPPTFHWRGKNDTMLMMLNTLRQGPEIEKALNKYGIPHVYKVYENAPHTCAVGNGTDAEGWLTEAVAFWEEQTAK